MPAGTTLAFARGLKSNFLQTYQAKTRIIDKRLSEIMDLGVQSDGAAEDYFYYLSAPHPEYVETGKGPTAQSFTGRGFRAVNREWKLKIEWPYTWEQDDQTKGLVKQARQGGRNFRLLPERLLFQIITASANSKLLPTIPTCADGSALFATTNGAGTARFGATNGNLLAGNSLNTGGDVRSAVYQAIEQFSLFQDTEGQPLYLEDTVESNGIMVVFNVQNLEKFEKAFKQARTVVEVTNLAGTENVAAAAPSNVIMDAGHKISLWGTQRITDDSIYVFIRNPETKAVFFQTREPLRDNIQDFANSDIARNTDMRALYWRMRGTAHVHGDPYMAIKITT